MSLSQNSRQELLRQIPAVDQILQRPAVADWVKRTCRGFVVAEIKQILNDIRNCIRSGSSCTDLVPDSAGIERRLIAQIERQLKPVLTSVINATGVILHTNLGRAPLSLAAQKSLSAISAQYTNLEYDLLKGERSHRDKLIEPALRLLLGSEAGTVVNNNAAAVFLILETLASGKEVVVSRGELIEIGGSFRIPDIMTRSGARLREVGTTNKSRLEDYEAAIGPETALILRVHPSNYRIRGFTERPSLKSLVDLTRRHNLPLVEDIGSGCLVDLRPYGNIDEPLAQESIAAGVSLVCFSADKLLGGPQAGIIAGERRWIDMIRANPLMRVCRVEKLIYGALEATLNSYRVGQALQDIPVLRMLTMTSTEIQSRCSRFSSRLRRKVQDAARIELAAGKSVVGGGSCPDVGLETVLLELTAPRLSPGEIERRLRINVPPIIVRLEKDKVLVDLRTVFPQQEKALLEGILEAVSAKEPDIDSARSE